MSLADTASIVTLLRLFFNHSFFMSYSWLLVGTLTFGLASGAAAQTVGTVAVAPLAFAGVMATRPVAPPAPAGVKAARPVAPPAPAAEASALAFVPAERKVNQLAKPASRHGLLLYTETNEASKPIHISAWRQIKVRSIVDSTWCRAVFGGSYFYAKRADISAAQPCPGPGEADDLSAPGDCPHHAGCKGIANYARPAHH